MLLTDTISLYPDIGDYILHYATVVMGVAQNSETDMIDDRIMGTINILTNRVRTDMAPPYDYQENVVFVAQSAVNIGPQLTLAGRKI